LNNRHHILGLALVVACAVDIARATSENFLELNRLSEHASCLIDAMSVVKLASQSQGVLGHVYVHRGDLVKQGQIVADLESSVEEALLKGASVKAQSDAAIRSKEAELSGAKKKLVRQKALANNQFASQQALENAETDVEVLTAQLTQAHIDSELARIDAERIAATLERRKIVSPVSGVVASVDHFPGEYADSNTIVATALEVDPLRVELYLPLAAYKLVEAGQSARVMPASPFQGSYQAKVVAKDRQIDAASNLFQIQLNLENRDLLIPAGLRCSVEFGR
jgi:RND family efflux transporter MFP subunit